MQDIQKGALLHQFIGTNGLYFNTTGNIATILIIADDTALEKYKLRESYKFWCIEVDYSLILFGCKIGDSNWVVAPFTPYKSYDFNRTHFQKGKGMPVTIAKVSNNTGEVIDIDLVELGDEMSNTIVELTNYILQSPYDEKRNQKALSTVYRKFDTDEKLVNGVNGCTYSIDLKKS